MTTRKNRSEARRYSLPDDVIPSGVAFATVEAAFATVEAAFAAVGPAFAAVGPAFAAVGPAFAPTADGPVTGAIASVARHCRADRTTSPRSAVATAEIGVVRAATRPRTG
jgi:hypothetical protein